MCEIYVEYQKDSRVEIRDWLIANISDATPTASGMSGVDSNGKFVWRLHIYKPYVLFNSEHAASWFLLRWPSVVVDSNNFLTTTKETQNGSPNLAQEVPNL